MNCLRCATPVYSLRIPLCAACVRPLATLTPAQIIAALEAGLK